MSKSESREFANFREKVIIRAAGDEPVILTAISMGAGAVDAVGADEELPVAFHATRTFRHDDQLYQKLKRAFERQDREQLSRLWSEAARFAPPVTA
jgi:hypothetical protein